MATTGERKSDVTTAAAPAARGSRVRLAIGAAAVAAVTIAALGWWRPHWMPLGGSDRQFDVLTRDLVAAVGRQRFSEARLAEPFSWGALPSPTRGEAPLADPVIRIAALRILESAPNRP